MAAPAAAITIPAAVAIGAAAPVKVATTVCPALDAEALTEDAADEAEALKEAALAELIALLRAELAIVVPAPATAEVMEAAEEVEALALLDIMLDIMLLALVAARVEDTTEDTAEEIAEETEDAAIELDIGVVAAAEEAMVAAELAAVDAPPDEAE